MSQENVERAVHLYDVWNADGIEAVAQDFWAHEIEWRDDPSVPDAASYRNRDEVRSHIADRVAVLGHFQIHLERAIEVSTDEVLVIYEVMGEGGQSAAPWKQRMAQALLFKDGRVIEVQDYLDVDRALQAAGLSD